MSGSPPVDLGAELLPDDTVGLLAGDASVRAIRRYADQPIPAAAFCAVLFAATRGSSGSDREPLRFIVLTDGRRNAVEVKALLAEGSRLMWAHKRATDGYRDGSVA